MHWLVYWWVLELNKKIETFKKIKLLLNSKLNVKKVDTVEEILTWFWVFETASRGASGSVLNKNNSKKILSYCWSDNFHYVNSNFVSYFAWSTKQSNVEQLQRCAK